MRKIAGVLTASLWLLCAVSNGFAASAIEFYQNLLRRGVADFNAGRFDAAERELRIAAFGLVDAIDQYQTAHIYLALSADRLGHTEEARRAVDRVQAAQRVTASYPSLPLPAEIRTAFDALIQRQLPTAIAPLNGAAPKRKNGSASPPRATKPPPAVKPQPAKPAPPQQETAKAPAKEPALLEREIPFEAPAVPAPTPILAPPVPAPPMATPPMTSQSAPAPRLPAPQLRRDLAAAERALLADDLVTARAIYRENLDVTSDHATLLRIAEGLYRARDFAGALAAFGRGGELGAGEQPYRYYRAVAYYETGDYARAKAEMEAALPHIEITSEVARSRAKILGAIN